MRWARGVVVEWDASIRNVPSLLTATMRVTVVGTGAGPIVVHAFPTSLDVIAETAIGTLTIIVGDAAIAVISRPIDRTSLIARTSREGWLVLFSGSSILEVGLLDTF